MQRRRFIAASMGAVAGMVSGCVPGKQQYQGELTTGAALAFGTTVTVGLFHADRTLADRAIGAALREMQDVDRLMSIYQPDSQVARLNREGVLAKPDPRLLAVLAQARALSVKSRGAFDITVQPLWQTYSAAVAAGATPRADDLQAASAKVNWRHVKASASEVMFEQPGMAITLNGLAQGFAADLALEALRACGIDHALVDAGEFAADGHKPGPQPWTIGIADPRDAEVMASTIRMDGRCVATSGDYASAFTPDFVHHHIFDPATGASPRDLASVTVLAPTAMLADGLSTTFMVMGARKAHAMAAAMPLIDLMTINKRGVVWKSAGFPRST